MSGPIIGIVMQHQDAIPGQSVPAWNIGAKYVRVLAAAGATPWLIPLLPESEATLRAIYERLDGLFLMGGADVDPAAYGEAKLPCCQETDPPRDATETRLIRWAMEDRKVLFGVCRGIQMLNVALGGDLYQDLREQRPGALRHDYFSSTGQFSRNYLSHPVRVESGSRLAEVLGSTELPVNSMHHQGIRRLAPSLRATTFAPDGLIEGVEGTTDQYLVGVQWHPEELTETDEPSRRLFAAFVDAARG